VFAAANQQHNILKSRPSLPTLVGVFLDPIVVVASLLGVTVYLHAKFDAPYFILALIAFSMSFPGRSQLGVRFSVMARDIIVTWLILSIVLAFFGYASGYLSAFPENVLIAWFFAAPVAQLVTHQIVRVVMPRVLAMRANCRNAVIVGANETGLQLARTIRATPFLGIQVVGFFDDRSRARLGEVGGFPLLGSMTNLVSFAKQSGIDLIYLALPMATQPRILSLLDDLRDTTSSIYFVPDIFVTDLIQARMDDVGGVAVVAVCETPFTGVNGLVKRVSDVALATLILILILPLIMILAVGVKVSSSGPVLFKQRRYGLDGKQIIVYKFRSMTVWEDGAEIPQATPKDVRVTPFGAFMRRHSLDELPQFVNVLQGRMSIVGPRPHAVAHNEAYRKLIKGYMVRHKVKPGITGWAQVNGLRGETETLDKMKARIEYDLAYLRNWSLRLDLQIIARTIWISLSGDRHAY